MIPPTKMRITVRKINTVLNLETSDRDCGFVACRLNKETDHVFTFGFPRLKNDIYLGFKP